MNMRGFHLSTKNFTEISKIVYQNTGIVLKDHKRSLVISRISRRLRALGLNSFDAYLAHLDSNSAEAEFPHLINSITTNKTDFFRESHHFDYLQKKLPQICTKIRQQGRKKLRIWSSACSTGEEPYTIAMVINRTMASNFGIQTAILASDIDTNVLKKAHAGIYSTHTIKPIPPIYSEHLIKEPDGNYRISEKLRQYVRFRRIDLIQETFHFSEPVDIIFCRNVMIYFDEPTRNKILMKFHKILPREGLIFIGHSESLLSMKSHFNFLGSSIYSKA